MIRIALVTCVLAAVGCKKNADPVVARLVELTAQVERMPRAQAPWQPAAVGNTFIIGSGVRTGASSRAKLRVGKSSNLDVEPSSVVYFTRTPGRDRNDLRVEAGNVVLETGDETIGIGEAVLDPNTRARIEAGPQGTTLVVTVGRVVLEDDEIAAGQRITLAPAGRATPRAAAVDAGQAPATDGTIAIAVRDKPVRVKTATGETELGVGEHTVEAGATLSVPAGSTLEISRGGARAVTTGPAELTAGEGSSLVDVASGGVTLHGESAAATATVPGGTITATASSEAALAVDGKQTAIDAQRGETQIAGSKGTQTLAAGQSAYLGKNGDITLAPAPPSRTVVSIRAGEAATVHDAGAPTPVRVAFGDACAGTGVLEVAKDRAFKKIVARSGGAGAANAFVGAGTHYYRVRCAGGKGASGTVRVAKDSGRTPLPKAAARTTVEMDGREYTVLYQNLLPAMTLSWRRAPRGKSRYTFVITPQRGPVKRLVGTSPSMQLVAGELREGSYRVSAEADGGARSEESRIVIEFDNAAQSVSIDGVDASDGKVRVKGTAIESSTVSVDGAPVALDRHRRFSAELTPGPSEDGASIRIAHPKAGIHYYVMRTGPT